MLSLPVYLPVKAGSCVLGGAHPVGLRHARVDHHSRRHRQRSFELRVGYLTRSAGTALRATARANAS
jgi:hypothetical protein